MPVVRLTAFYSAFYCNVDGRLPVLSSAANADTIIKATVALGQCLAGSGVELVYGGGNIGLMGTVARSVDVAGGVVRGVIPEVDLGVGTGHFHVFARVRAWECWWVAGRV